MSGRSSICLYTAQTPNGHKISIVLEELGMSYDIKHVSLPNMDHKSEWFMEINPNGRVPALTDVMPDGTRVELFESGAIMQYLVDRYDVDHQISYPHGSKEFYQTNSWLFFQNAGLGPMQGQLVWFSIYGPPARQTFAIDRYTTECHRLYHTMDKYLSNSGTQFFIGDKCTIADIAITSWVKMAPIAGLDLSQFPHLQMWHNQMQQRPGVMRGIDVPVKTGDVTEVRRTPENFKACVAQNSDWARAGTPLEKTAGVPVVDGTG